MLKLTLSVILILSSKMFVPASSMATDKIQGRTKEFWDLWSTVASLE